MKGMTVDIYGNVAFDPSTKLTSEELEQQLKSIDLGPINETIIVTGNKGGSVTTTTIDHITGTQHQTESKLNQNTVTASYGNIHFQTGCIDFSYRNKSAKSNLFFSTPHPDSSLISDAETLYKSLEEKYANDRDVKELFEEFQQICKPIKNPSVLTLEQKDKIKRNVEELEGILRVIDNSLNKI